MSRGFVQPWLSSRISQNIIYVLLVISQIVDIYLDVDEIADNYRRMIGRSTKNRTNEAGTLRLSISQNG